MKRAATIAIPLAVLAGCSSHSDPPANHDAAFLKKVHDVSDAQYAAVPDSGKINAAKALCSDLKKNAQANKGIAAVLTQRSFTGLSDDDAKTIVSSSIDEYCPDQDR